MGRTRKPASVLKLHGTYRKDRHAGRLENADGEPTSPEDLDKDAKWLWDSVLRGVPDGVLGQVDESELFALCRWWSVWRKLDRDIQENGPTRFNVPAAASAWKQFMVIAPRFGLSPTDRAKLKAPESKGDDIEQKFFAG